MALFSTAHSSPFFSKTHNPTYTQFPISKPPPSTLFFLRITNQSPTSRFPSLLSRYSPDLDPAPRVTDEWGEKSEPESETLKGPATDPPANEGEWEEKDGVRNGGTPFQPMPGVVEKKDDGTQDLKRSLADTVYITDFGVNDEDGGSGTKGEAAAEK